MFKKKVLQIKREAQAIWGKSLLHCLSREHKPSSESPLMGLETFTAMMVHWGERDTETSPKLVDTSSWADTNSWPQKYHCIIGPRVYFWCLVTEGVSPSSTCRRGRPWPKPWLFPECKGNMAIFHNFQNVCIGSLTCGEMADIIGARRWKFFWISLL